MYSMMIHQGELFEQFSLMIHDICTGIDILYRVQYHYQTYNVSYCTVYHLGVQSHPPKLATRYVTYGLQALGPLDSRPDFWNSAHRVRLRVKHILFQVNSVLLDRHLHQVQILERFAKPEGLHAIVWPSRFLPHIRPRTITVLRFAIFVDRFKHFPAPLPVDRVAL